MTTKAFHLGDILTVISGKFCTPNGMGGVEALLVWMTGEEHGLMTHQLPRVADECEADLARQHPDLSQVAVPKFSDEAEGLAWLAEQVARFGEYRDVAPLVPNDHTRINPVAELRMMRLVAAREVGGDRG